jgi:hypothetical protein
MSSALLLAFTLTPLTFFLTVPAFSTGLKVSALLPYILSLYCFLVSLAVGVLIPKLSTGMSAGATLAVFLCVAIDIKSPLATFVVLVPSLSVVGAVLSLRPRLLPPMEVGARSLVAANALLLLADALPVLALNKPGFYMRGVFETLTAYGGRVSGKAYPSLPASPHGAHPSPRQAALMWLTLSLVLAAVQMHRRGLLKEVWAMLTNRSSHE